MSKEKILKLSKKVIDYIMVSNEINRRLKNENKN